MPAYIAHAEGSVSSTVVIDASNLPLDTDAITSYLLRFHDYIHQENSGLISKYALIRRSEHPMFDLYYRFVQLVPGPEPAFNFQGSCGHSVLAAINVAFKWGWLPAPSPGARVRVFIENNGDHFVCEVDEANRDFLVHTAHFIYPVGTKLSKFLLTGNPINVLATPFGNIPVSIVSAGNPYVFVNAESLQISSAYDLVHAGPDIFDKLQMIRATASGLLGWDPKNVFPKIAMVGAYGDQCLTVKAISVPGWHPTMALTGLSCISIAGAMADTVVGRLVMQNECLRNGRLNIQTKNGRMAVTCITSGNQVFDEVYFTSIPNKHVRCVAELPMHLSLRSESEWPSAVYV